MIEFLSGKITVVTVFVEYVIRAVSRELLGAVVTRLVWSRQISTVHRPLDTNHQKILKSTSLRLLMAIQDRYCVGFLT